MLVIPAIDLKAGQCVRLYQGDMDKATVYADDPVETARRWQGEGAQRLHVVDLDAAVGRGEENRAAIGRICHAVRIPVQVGGGVRSVEGLERLLSLGVERTILGTLAYREPATVAEACRRFPGRITVGIDARNGKVAVHGWTETTGLDAVELAVRCQDQGVGEIVYTDIARDGTQRGVNDAATRALAEAVSIPVIASGGVASVADVERLLPLGAVGVTGVIVGRALYTGGLHLRDAIRIATARTPG